ncbi:MAG: hypothetical protein A2487_06250 [Candidatus Raymondbacteria bacterium RifOxyC12_full_50_8]|uniref:Two component regulator propeller n=1 Tax=Candidatus Raymondbacteria bacterium RIFOXYD12_FULL_49_13 TaxID=1817890 RepID=A0A1F7FC52_UNCRA|nr:MAG: hypothetical protein A2248_03150 [Candidatus Raymondbacteria bacterium RIFOXYA2_FULL_49_16]OGJ93304.1 MAG: hypothetical protein A2350_14645 [Candidatus Raymondbacteria bacterium RifOxyB12_full_50_8]OGK04265.1 MAG: hypothetical protein A2519_18055 [Candidatus Raymondbacteria bacterium RIFOXYD12_FULL_49_13]OGK06049.1 MAG: hypothetical protein A2487_06250 [Candidatus Raymondbacteria bacterium RifOxyC12_full_50_8]OGP42452.1 MAG: hypothetical protein A2324_17185 [Candidatus Raymondbacteria b
MEFFAAYRKQSRRRRSVTAFFIGISAALLIIILYILFGVFSVPPSRNINFDTSQCVRFLEMSRVYAMLAPEGEKGPLWLASAEGLRQYYPRTGIWTRFGLDHGLPSEEVYDLCMAKGELWVGTERGCARFNAQSRSFFREPVFPAGDSGRALAVEYLPGRGLFCAFENGSIFLRPESSHVFIPFHVPGVRSKTRITCLKSHGNGLYIGFEGGQLFFYTPDKQSNSFRQIFFNRILDKNTSIWDVMDRKGQLWIATSDFGVWRCGAGGDTATIARNFPTRGAYVFEEETDGMWCGTPFGLWRYHDREDVWIQFVSERRRGIDELQIQCMLNFPDSIWYGDKNSGAGVIRKKEVEFVPMRAGLSRQNMSVITATDSLVCAGYGYQGGYCDLFSVEQFQLASHLDDRFDVLEPNITALLFDRGLLFYSGYHGFGYADCKADAYAFFTKTNDGRSLYDISCIEKLADRTDFFLGSPAGVICFHREQETFSLLAGTKSWRVTALCADSAGLWIGTLGNGLKRFDFSRDSVIGSFLDDKPGAVAVTHIGQDVYAAFKTQGVFVSKGAGRDFVALPITPDSVYGMAREERNTITAMRAIGKTLWVGTHDAGCYIYDTSAGEWRRLMASDGLVSGQVRSICATPSYVFIGCYGGVSRYHRGYAETLLNIRF